MKGNEKRSDVCHNTDKPQKHHAKCETARLQTDMLYDSIYFKLSRQGQFTETESRLVVTWGRGGVWTDCRWVLAGVAAVFQDQTEGRLCESRHVLNVSGWHSDNGGFHGV